MRNNNLLEERYWYGNLTGIVKKKTFPHYFHNFYKPPACFFKVMAPYIVIPAYNEEEKIFQVVKSLKNEGFPNVIVVDDGSSDKTSEKAKLAEATVLRHITNQGQGAALQTGMDWALDQGANVVVTFDADGQHQPGDIKDLVEPVMNNKVDVALGSRFLDKKSNVPIIRKLFLKAGTILLLVMYNIKLTDCHNGLRAFSSKALSKFKITQNGMEHASEIVEKIAKHKISYVEVPVTIRYSEYSLKKGQKTSNAFKILTKMALKKLMK
jgi:polyprenyl-phospho-N-acetylgalactosaminyl synthase